MQASAIGSRLDDLLQSGIHHVATFVPWQAFESDISHAFTRFLQGLAERNMTLSLILTPEVGVHFPNSGMPKDILGKSEALAQNANRGPVVVGLPPSVFALPSLLSSDFTKRYYSFLSRVDNMLADFERTQSRSLEFVTVTLTGSFWKYYRSPGALGRSVFTGAAGDYSSHAAVSFRQRIDDFYASPEFSSPSPMAANRWKTREMEAINRRWFYQQCEAVFRNRTLQFAHKRARTAQVAEIELFTPEADPWLAYTYFLQALAARPAASDFLRLSSLIDEAAAFGSMAGQTAATSFVHWSSLGGFRSLTDSERQFLFLKSLLLFGGRGGGLMIDEEEWFAFARGFRSRVETFSRLISQGDLRLRGEVAYLVPHLWTGPGALWIELSRKAGHAARKVASLDWIERDEGTRLVIVDPALVLTREAVQRLLAWAEKRDGRVVVLPNGALYSDSARAELDRLTSARTMEISLGIRYRVHAARGSKVVVYEVPDAELAPNPAADVAGPAWNGFLGAMLGLGEVAEPCQVSDSRLALIPLERHDRSVGLFVLNGTLRPVSGDILFASSVTISDLATEVSSSQAVASATAAKAAPARRFALDVPPCGILPLAVDRVGIASHFENKAADELGALNRANAISSAAAELPGLDMSFFDDTTGTPDGTEPDGVSSWN